MVDDDTIDDLEREVEYVKDEIDDLSREIQDLEKNFSNFKSKFNLERDFQNYLIPFSYEKHMGNFITEINQSRHFSNYEETILNYQKLKKSLKISKDIPFLITKKYFQNQKEILKIRNSKFLKNSIEFYKQAENVSDELKPIFYYYSSSQLFAFLINSLLYYNNPQLTHGIKTKKMYDAHKVAVKFEPVGFFQRIVDFLTIFGAPSCFSIPKSFTLENQKKYTKIENNKTKVLADNKKGLIPYTTGIEISMADLIEFKPFKSNYSFLQYPSYGSIKFSEVNNLLRNYIILFLASNLSRYQPNTWEVILLGKETDLIIKIKEIYMSFGSFYEFVLKILKLIKELLPYKLLF
ncbi:MAG: hypothetical protein EAX96_05700 [Candidatus Lokiarchaeota archaeon]|nr:hypothetical protein [Candidatus Lokiarchaeota archaeon]